MCLLGLTVAQKTETHPLVGASADSSRERTQFLGNGGTFHIPICLTQLVVQLLPDKVLILIRKFILG